MKPPTEKKKLTTASARNLELPSGKDDHTYWAEDFPGFGVRVRAGLKRISRNWVYQYDYAGHTRRMPLGNVNAIGIEVARKAAGELQSEVRLGNDPVREKAEKLERAAHTFANVMESYLTAAKECVRANSWRDMGYHLRRSCKPLHPLPFTAITRRDIASAVLTPIAARGARALSDRVRGTLNILFKWAIGQGLIENNPVVDTPRQKLKPRTRVLSLPELTAIWHTVGDIPIHPHTTTDYTGIVRLLMLTGQRRLEIGDLRYREIRDGESFIDDGIPIAGPAIVLPPERTKNGCKHIVPLSKPAQAILLTRPRGSDDERVLRFKSRSGSSRWKSKDPSVSTLLDWGRHKRSLDAALKERGHKLEPWVLHDLRRSVATHMGEMGIEPQVIEKVLNHTLGGVAGTYNRSKLEKRKRQAKAASRPIIFCSGRLELEPHHLGTGFWVGPGKVRSRYSAPHAAT